MLKKERSHALKLSPKSAVQQMKFSTAEFYLLWRTWDEGVEILEMIIINSSVLHNVHPVDFHGE